MALDFITAGVELVNNVVSRVFPDASQEKILEAEKVAAEQAADKELALAQIAVNLEEAKSELWWKSGWRPAAGWVCVGGLFYQLIFRSIIGWIMQNAFGWSLPPSLEMDTLMTVLFGLLGLGAYRTKEKLAGLVR